MKQNGAVGGLVLCRADNHLGVAGDLGLVAAAIDIAADVGRCRYGLVGVIFVDCTVGARHLKVGSNLDLRASDDLGCVATAEDVADDADGIGLVVSLTVAVCIDSGGMIAHLLLDADHGVARHHSRLAEATAIDGADAGAGYDVNLRVLRVVGVVGLVVGSLVAAAVEFADDDGLAARLLDGHFDGAVDGAALVVAAEHLAVLAALDDEVDVAMHVGRLGTAIDGIESAAQAADVEVRSHV